MFDVQNSFRHVHINDKIQYDYISNYRLTDNKPEFLLLYYFMKCKCLQHQECLWKASVC